MMSDDFIDTVITPESESGDATMLYRVFDGMEAVARFEDRESTQNGGENNE